jgi:iron complex outermembrane receptor protein
MRTISERSDLILSLYYDHTRLHDASLDETRDTYTADFQHRYITGRHELMWGFEGRSTKDELVRKGSIFFDPPGRTLNRATAFVQDRIGFGASREFALTLGSKFEHNNRTGFEYQPNVRLLWAPTDTTSMWASVSRAVRTPSRAANDLNVEIFPGTTIPAGNPDLESEELMAYELGARFSTFQRFYVDLVGFFNDYANLITTTGNDGKARSAGFEIASRWQCTRIWVLSAAYSFIDFIRIEPEDLTHAAPKNTANIRSNVDLPAGIEFDASAYYVDPAFSYIPDYARVDLRLGWKPVSRAGIDLVLRNLFDEAHAEAPEGTQLNTAVRRSVHVTARVRF